MAVSSLDRQQKSVRMSRDSTRSLLSIERYTEHSIHGHKGWPEAPLKRQNRSRISNRRPQALKIFPRQIPWSSHQAYKRKLRMLDKRYVHVFWTLRQKLVGGVRNRIVSLTIAVKRTTTSWLARESFHMWLSAARCAAFPHTARNQNRIPVDQTDKNVSILAALTHKLI